MQSELDEYQLKMLEYLKTSGVSGISGARFKEHDPEKGNMTHLEFVTSYRSVWCPEIVGEELMKDMYEMIHADSMPIKFNDSYDPNKQVPLIGEWEHKNIPDIKALRRYNEEGSITKFQINHLLNYVEALEDACKHWKNEGNKNG